MHLNTENKLESKHLSLLVVLLVTGIVVLFSLTVDAADSSNDELSHRKMCVWDIAGTNGPTFQAMKHYQTAALSWGVKLELHPYSDPKIATDDFKAGACDLVNIPGILGRNFNNFTGSLDAIGAVPSYEHLKILLQTLATDKASKYMKKGAFETVSIIPGGSVYLFLNDRGAVTLQKLAGKKVPVLDDAPEVRVFAEKAGLTPVSASITTAFSKFNNNAVDIIAGPAVVYEALELHKGLGEKGGIIKLPLMQLTLQIIARHDRFPEGFGEKSRLYAVNKFDESLALSLGAEGRLPKKYWITLSEKDQQDWMKVFKASRMNFLKEGIYNQKTLQLMWSVRCRKEPSLAECSSKDRV